MSHWGQAALLSECGALTMAGGMRYMYVVIQISIGSPSLTDLKDIAVIPIHLDAASILSFESIANAASAPERSVGSMS